MSEPTLTIKLKNGIDEVKPLVAIVMFSVNRLMEEGKATVVYELVQLCRDCEHKPWGRTGDDLKALELATEQDGQWQVHDSIRNIVLSAASGEGLDIVIGNPVAVAEPANAL